jgi:hypothetical protein
MLTQLAAALTCSSRANKRNYSRVADELTVRAVDTGGAHFRHFILFDRSVTFPLREGSVIQR